jgi:competence protein ComEA
MKRNIAERSEGSDGGPLSRQDQWIVAVLVLAGLAGIVAWWSYHGGWRGALVELDQAEPVDVTFVLDVNRAGWTELAQLPGIGETLARRIVHERDRGGRYIRVDEIESRVVGIGPKLFRQIRPHLRTSPREGPPPQTRDE